MELEKVTLFSLCCESKVATGRDRGDIETSESTDGSPSLGTVGCA